MLSPSIQLRNLLALAGGFVLLHCLGMLFFPTHAAAVSYPFVISAPLLAFAGCSRQFRFGAAQTRIQWTLVGGSLLLWSSGMMIEAWEDLSQHVSPEIASFSDFNLFIYGVPILLAISTPTRRDSIPLFRWLDGIQAAITAYLIYVAFFSVSPFTHKPIQPIRADHLVLIYTLESVALAAGASLRLLSSNREGVTRHFYKVLSTYLCIYAVCIGFLNYGYLAFAGKTGYFDLFVDIPFLYLAIAAVRSSPRPAELQPSPDRRSLIVFADNISPIFFTAALISLCFAVLRTNFYAGLISMVIAFAVYSIRATALQSRFMQTQQELVEARDRLEEISLTDALTGVANRRCFDRTLIEEWDRAVRTRQPLSLLMIDVDYFKNVNDRHGHQYGDGCLQKIAQGMRDMLPRSGDLLARYGGEEFVILLPTTGKAGGDAVATKMLHAVAALQIGNESPVGPFATISIGFSVAEFPTQATFTQLIEGADIALYHAKQNGRNRVEYRPLGG